MQRLISVLGILFVVATVVFVGLRVAKPFEQPPGQVADSAQSASGNLFGRIAEALRTGDENNTMVVVTARKRDADEGAGASEGGNASSEPLAPEPEAQPAAPPEVQAEMNARARALEQEERNLAAEDKSFDAEKAPDADTFGGAPPGVTSPGAEDNLTVGAPPPPSAAAPSASAPATTMAKPAPAPKDDAALTIQRVTVYYGTDRTLEKQDGKLVYGSLPQDKLDYGSVDVTLPPKHQRGALERPQWWRFEFVPDPQKHVVFTGFERLSETKFLASVRGLVAKSAHKQAFVFIHGFNTSFEDAALRTAQLHHDLNFDGAPIFYSWSSRAELTPLAYAADGTAADQTVPQLAKFLQLVAEQTGAERVHVIAHSMGNRALVGALAELEQSAPKGRNKRPFHQIVLAAPDIDRKVFERLASHIQDEADNITLYASAHDGALKASLKFNGFPRAGDATGGVVIVPGITTIDASAVATELFSFGHSFFADSRSVLDDIRALFNSGGLPDKRGLHPVKIGNSVYWRID